MSYATSPAPQAYAYNQQAQSSSSTHSQYYGQSGYPLHSQGAAARNTQFGGQANASNAYPYPAQQPGYQMQTPFTVPSNAPASSHSHSYPAATPQPSSMHYRHDSNPPSSPSPSSANVERFPCPYCSKSFTRNFDRKRHMEIHTPGSSGNNRCLYCRKEYSRADSLKRHIDNGCEMKPTR